MSTSNRLALAGLLVALFLAVLFWWDPGRLWRPCTAPIAAGSGRAAGPPAGWAGRAELGEAAGTSNREAPSDPVRRAVLAGLWIQVVDSKGRPVPGIPVGLALGREASDPCWEGVTQGEEGLVEAPIPEYTQQQEVAEGAAPCPAYAFLSLPLAGAQAKEFDPTSPPDEPIRLLLPPTGQVAVRVAMEDVGPLPFERRVVLLRHGAEKGGYVHGPMPMKELQVLPRGQEELLFGHVALGVCATEGKGTGGYDQLGLLLPD